MRSVRYFAVGASFLFVGLASQQAFAQKIRTYGDAAPAPPPAPAPAPSNQAAAPATTPANGQAGADTPDDYSHVTVFKPGGANAPLPVDLTPDKMYRGVIPGTRDEVSHLIKAREKASDRSNRNQVTWIGFQATDETTRVFFQTGRESSYDLGEEGSLVTVTFSDTRLSARNFGRFIDTSFFNRNVTRIEVDQVDKSTVVAKIFLRQGERPDVDRSGNYLYLDFSSKETKSEESSSDEENAAE